MWHQAGNNQTPNFGGYSKLCYKKLQSLVYKHKQQECSETAQEQRMALYKSDQQQQINGDGTNWVRTRHLFHSVTS